MMHHLVGVSEIAAMIGVSRQRVHQLAQEDPTFPEPAVVISAGSVWERKAVEEWAERTGRTVQRDDG
ncbi:MAG: helix-turn-helix transcriptional regulator [Nocardioidaceae bacterium]